MRNTLKYLFLFLTTIVIAGYAFISVQAQGLLAEDSGGSSADIIAQKFINQINILNSVKIETSIFNDASFQSFVDWSRPIPEEEKGRDNPFAPIN